MIHDVAREQYNPVTKRLHPNTNETETVAGDGPIDFTANGFKIRTTTTHSGGGAETYVYMACADTAFGGSGVTQARAR